jgi:multisubunit Na+/H+ antiporter MnhC subunit
MKTLFKILATVGVIAAVIVTWAWAADTHPDTPTFLHALGHNIGVMVVAALYWTLIITAIGIGLAVLAAIIISPFYWSITSKIEKRFIKAEALSKDTKAEKLSF